MPDWPEEEFPTTQQVGVYLLFWEHQRKQLAPDPGAGFLQKSYWLDPEDLEISAYQAECLRAGRPDRALFIRRLIATYHKRRTERPIRVSSAAVTHPAPATVFHWISGHSSGVTTSLSTASSSVSSAAVTHPAPATVSTGLVRAIHQVSRQVSAPPAVREAELSPAQVNEISRSQGLGICWQPGNVYRVGKAVNGKSCLVQIDLLGRELARYGSW